MLRGPRRPRDLAVGDIPHKQMPERVFRLTRDRRALRALYELLALQRVKKLFGSVALSALDRRSGAAPCRPRGPAAYTGVLVFVFQPKWIVWPGPQFGTALLSDDGPSSLPFAWDRTAWRAFLLVRQG